MPQIESMKLVSPAVAHLLAIQVEKGLHMGGSERQCLSLSHRKVVSCDKEGKIAHTPACKAALSPGWCFFCKNPLAQIIAPGRRDALPQTHVLFNVPNEVLVLPLDHTFIKVANRAERINGVNHSSMTHWKRRKSRTKV